MAEPEPPINVRLLDWDNTEWPVQCVYLGAENGVHTWQVVMPDSWRRDLNRVRGLRITTLPGRTQVVLPLGL